jgi:hypothetical protein
MEVTTKADIYITTHHLAKYAVDLTFHGGYRKAISKSTITIDVAAGGLFTRDGQENGIYYYIGPPGDIEDELYYANRLLFKTGGCLTYRHSVFGNLSIGASAGGYMVAGGFRDYEGRKNKVADPLFYFPVMVTTAFRF